MQRKLNQQLVEKIAKQCKTKSEFVKKDNSAYNFARKHKILNKICSHMITVEDISREKIKSKTKKCGKCKVNKKKNEFNRNSLTIDGFQNYCKICNKKVVMDFNKTQKGVLNSIYKDQFKNSKIRNHNKPQYSKAELRDWMYKKGFEDLYNLWVKSNFDRLEKPSIDRLNDSIGYSFENIRLTTWKTNVEKAYQNRKDGVGTQGSVCKKVIQYDKNMNLIKIYISESEAERKTGVPQGNISKVCLGKRKKAGGFIWQHLNQEEDKLIIKIEEIK